MDKSNTFSISESISEAWAIIKADIWRFILFFFVYILASQAIAIPMALSVKGSTTYYLLNALSIAISLYLTAGFIDANLHVLDGNRLDISRLFKNYKSILNMFLASIVSNIIIIIGLICLVIPGIIFIVRLNFTITLIVDKNLGVFDAVKTSWQITKGNFWNLIGLYLISVLIVLAGIIALLVGAFVAIPVIALAYFIVYRKLLPADFDEIMIVPSDENKINSAEESI